MNHCANDKHSARSLSFSSTEEVSMAAATTTTATTSNEVLHPYDVLLGRGRSIYTHSGNAFFHKLVDQHRPLYLALVKHHTDKKPFWRKIYNIIVLQYGGRFVRQDMDVYYYQNKIQYTPVDIHTALAKIGQALREPRAKHSLERQDRMMHQNLNGRKVVSSTIALHGKSRTQPRGMVEASSQSERNGETATILLKEGEAKRPMAKQKEVICAKDNNNAILLSTTPHHRRATRRTPGGMVEESHQWYSEHRGTRPMAKKKLSAKGNSKNVVFRTKNGSASKRQNVTTTSSDDDTSSSSRASTNDHHNYITGAQKPIAASPCGAAVDGTCWDLFCRLCSPGISEEWRTFFTFQEDLVGEPSPSRPPPFRCQTVVPVFAGK